MIYSHHTQINKWLTPLARPSKLTHRLPADLSQTADRALRAATLQGWPVGWQSRDIREPTKDGQYGETFCALRRRIKWLGAISSRSPGIFHNPGRRRISGAGELAGPEKFEGIFYNSRGMASIKPRFRDGKWQGFWDAEGECDGQLTLARAR